MVIASELGQPQQQHRPGCQTQQFSNSGGGSRQHSPVTYDPQYSQLPETPNGYFTRFAQDLMRPDVTSDF